MSFTGEVSAIVMHPSSSVRVGRDRRIRRRGSPSGGGSSRDAWIKDGRRKPAWNRGASTRGERSPSGANHGAWSLDERSRDRLIRGEGSQIGPVACRRDECSRRPSSLVQVLKPRLVLRQGGFSPGVCHA